MDVDELIGTELAILSAKQALRETEQKEEKSATPPIDEAPDQAMSM